MISVRVIFAKSPPFFMIASVGSLSYVDLRTPKKHHRVLCVPPLMMVARVHDLAFRHGLIVTPFLYDSVSQVSLIYLSSFYLDVDDSFIHFSNVVLSLEHSSFAHCESLSSGGVNHHRLSSLLLPSPQPKSPMYPIVNKVSLVHHFIYFKNKIYIIAFFNLVDFDSFKPGTLLSFLSIHDEKL